MVRWERRKRWWWRDFSSQRLNHGHGKRGEKEKVMSFFSWLFFEKTRDQSLYIYILESSCLIILKISSSSVYGPRPTSCNPCPFKKRNMLHFLLFSENINRDFPCFALCEIVFDKESLGIYSPIVTADLPVCKSCRKRRVGRIRFSLFFFHLGASVACTARAKEEESAKSQQPNH